MSRIAQPEDLFFGIESWGSFLGVRSEVYTKQSVSRKGQSRDPFFGMELWGSLIWVYGVKLRPRKARLE